MRKIYLVRHGESEANAKDIFGGVLDVPITKKGEKQASETGKKLAKQIGSVDLIISSPMKRARRTAEIIAAELNYPVEDIVEEPRIVEINSGDFEGGPFDWEQVEARNKLLIDSKKEKGVEPIHEIVDRVTSFHNDVKSRPEKTILVIGHGVSGRFLRRVFAGLEPTEPVPHLDNATIFQLYPYEEVESEDLRL